MSPVPHSTGNGVIIHAGLFIVGGSVAGSIMFWQRGGMAGLGGGIVFLFAGAITLLILPAMLSPLKVLDRWIERRFGCDKKEDGHAPR